MMDAMAVREALMEIRNKFGLGCEIKMGDDDFSIVGYDALEATTGTGDTERVVEDGVLTRNFEGYWRDFEEDGNTEIDTLKKVLDEIDDSNRALADAGVKLMLEKPYEKRKSETRTDDPEYVAATQTASRYREGC